MPVLIKGSRKFSNGENWKVFHPNGKHMFTTNERKANWYLKKNKAVIVADNSIQLTFIPNGEGFANDEIFGLTPRINQCVVCGTDENLTRHHIVPYHYRKFMPINYKSRNHHDVALVCRKHHEEYEELAKPYKTELAKSYGVETIEELNGRYINNVVNRLKVKFKLSRMLYTLVYDFNNLPIRNVDSICIEIKRISNLDCSVLDLSSIEKIYNKLQKVIEREKKEITKVDEYFHGKQIIDKFKTHQDFEKFVKDWRKHFVDTMNPKFMPEGWSIDFRVRVKN